MNVEIELDLIECVQCHQKMKTITPTHLKNVLGEGIYRHNKLSGCVGPARTVEEYKRLYPDVPRASKGTKNLWSETAKERLTFWTDEQKARNFAILSQLGSAKTKEMLMGMTPEEKAIRMRPFLRLSQTKNKSEIRLEMLDARLKYVGQWEFWIRCEDQDRNPDFIIEPITVTKKVIELFGDYWHSKSITGLEEDVHEKMHVQMLKKAGYECLVVWERELKNEETLKQKLNEFISAFCY